MGTPTAAAATLEEHLGAGGTQALLTTLQRLAQAASTSPEQHEYRVQLVDPRALQEGCPGANT